MYNGDGSNRGSATSCTSASMSAGVPDADPIVSPLLCRAFLTSDKATSGELLSWLRWHRNMYFSRGECMSARYCAVSALSMCPLQARMRALRYSGYGPKRSMLRS